MNRGARRGFLLAKIYGIVARSYLGGNFRELLRLKSLQDLQELLWPAGSGEAAPLIPVSDMEARIARARISAMRFVLDYLGKPAAILVHMLRRGECQNLKIVLRGLEAGQVDAARLQDLGPYAGLPLAGVTDYEKAVSASPYAWTLAAMKTLPRARLENRIDREYFVEFLRLARLLPRADRAGILRYVLLEISLINAVWALRLRFSFDLDGAAAQPLLIPGLGDTMRKAVAHAFDIAHDSLDEWRRWRFGWLLADQLGEAFHNPDPVRAEASASRRLYVRAHQLLHQQPFTLCPLVAYFALKQQEAALLTTAVEALALGVPEKEVLALAGER